LVIVGHGYDFFEVFREVVMDFVGEGGEVFLLFGHYHIIRFINFIR